jgi:hypothetical protein
VLPRPKTMLTIVCGSSRGATVTAARGAMASELPFAGHPTLGTCHAWLISRGRPRAQDRIVQRCGAGLVPIRRTPKGLAFAAPPLLRSDPVDESLREHIAEVLRIEHSEIIDSLWVDNGPGWVAVLLSSAEAVPALRPGFVDLDLGVVGPYRLGAEAPPNFAASFRSRGDRRRSRHREPERFGGAVPDRDRPRLHALCCQPRYRSWPRRSYRDQPRR